MCQKQLVLLNQKIDHHAQFRHHGQFSVNARKLPDFCPTLVSFISRCLSTQELGKGGVKYAAQGQDNHNPNKDHDDLLQTALFLLFIIIHLKTLLSHDLQQFYNK
ncbi:hypothetical protein AV544_02755 [Pediococcus acidilactici]|nr:hypothetical protein AV544_02755 [Pediococcus acidilactici]OAC46986.1 hypothetical protein AWN64_02765 [Pediococcus acidilactici]